jgi:hypothetical protein
MKPKGCLATFGAFNASTSNGCMRRGNEFLFGDLSPMAIQLSEVDSTRPFPACSSVLSRVVRIQ